MSSKKSKQSKTNHSFIILLLRSCWGTIRFADRLVTALSGRVDLGARRVWGKLGNLLGLLSPAPSDVSEFCTRGELEASQCSLTCCHRAGEAGLSLRFGFRVHEIMRAIDQVLWLFNCWTFQVYLSIIWIWFFLISHN